MLLILTIIFLCRPLQPGWNSLDILKIFPRYFLFLPLPLACSYSASPKYVCHMWGVLRPRLKMCTWVCMCTWMCSQCILLARGMGGGRIPMCVFGRGFHLKAKVTAFCFWQTWAQIQPESPRCLWGTGRHISPWHRPCSIITLHMEDKKRKAQPSALASSGGQDRRRVWGIRYQVTEDPEQSRKSQESRKESESGM